MRIDKKELEVGIIDPKAGLMSLEVYWRPKASDPDPMMPGEKLSISMFRRCAPDDPCLCGSGRAFKNCCRRRKKWTVVCPDPGEESFSKAQVHELRYPIHDVAALRRAFMADRRLQCVTDGPGNDGFWLFFGYPPVEVPEYGQLNFGDLEIQGGTLLVTAMSATRYRVLRALLDEIAGKALGQPAINRQAPITMEKPSGPRIVPVRRPPPPGRGPR